VKGIRKRSDGVWFADYRTDGRRIRKFFVSGPGGRRAAIAFLTARRAQVTLGQHPGPTRHLPTFAEFAATYLRHLDSAGRRPKTCEVNEIMLRVHLTPAFGLLPLDRVTKASVIAFLEEKRSAGYASQTVEKMRTVLSGLLSHAVYCDLLLVNVVRAVKSCAPGADDGEALRVLTPAQVQTLLRVAREPYRTLYTTAIHAGLRRGELLALRWSDIDFSAGRIHVTRGRQRVKTATGYAVVDGPTKSRAGRRTVDMFPDLREALLALPAGDDPDQDYVFRSQHGGPLDPDNLKRRFKRDLALAGLPSIRLHDLRHTHASLLIASGAHPKLVQARLGHGSIRVTMDVYGHLLPNAFAGVGAQFDALLHPRCLSAHLASAPDLAPAHDYAARL
jgi:integrase